MPRPDPVNHPSHYKAGAFEVLDIIEAFGLDYHRGNVAKYLLRAGRKDKGKELEDLKKARFYLERIIARMEETHAALREGLAQG